jgi:glycosyltransferase involved in cell wall biosynthesis
MILLSGVTHLGMPQALNELDCVFFDQWCSLGLGECEFLLGAASSSVVSGRRQKGRGGIYVLDRACPDIRVQQQWMVEEAAKAGGRFRRNSEWFIERQVEEYELADTILVPSEFSARTFPEDLQKKIVVAPLYGRAVVRPRVAKAAGGTFVLGVVGGHPLRKGYLYLLQAWKELALPNVELRLRADSEIFEFPVLAKLVAEQPSVSVVGYVADIGEFYAGCDAFLLPSIDDGFGMALMEALANGLPSIATRNCGASELLVAERDLLVIDAFSVEQIKDAILRLYESPELRARLEVAGPAAVAALQVAMPFEAGMDRLLAAVGK